MRLRIQKALGERHSRSHPPCVCICIIPLKLHSICYQSWGRWSHCMVGMEHVFASGVAVAVALLRCQQFIKRHHARNTFPTLANAKVSESATKTAFTFLPSPPTASSPTLGSAPMCPPSPQLARHPDSPPCQHRPPSPSPHAATHYTPRIRNWSRQRNRSLGMVSSTKSKSLLPPRNRAAMQALRGLETDHGTIICMVDA